MNIVLCYPVEKRHLDRIAAVCPEANIIDAGQQRIAEALLEADIFCGHAKVPVDWDAVVARGRLQWIQSSAAGMDHCLVPSVIESDEIIVTSASGVLADQVAEHAMSLLLAWMRSLPTFFRAHQKREFIRRPTRDLTGATVGIVGFGGVGRRVAQVLAPWKTRLLAVDLFPEDKPETVESLWPDDRLDELLRQSEVVILCLPLNDQTRYLIDAAKFRLMKPEALLANMARGPLVVTEDLMEAIRQKEIAGAVMDVTDPEPLLSNHPLWEYESIIITPHVAGQCRSRIDDMTRLFCENLRRWQSDRPLINHVVDKSSGFPFRDGKTPLWIDLNDSVGW
jgi:D-3-phosphoglycerate dehydrogenase